MPLYCVNRTCTSARREKLCIKRRQKNIGEISDTKAPHGSNNLRYVTRHCLFFCWAMFPLKYKYLKTYICNRFLFNASVLCVQNMHISKKREAVHKKTTT